MGRGVMYSRTADRQTVILELISPDDYQNNTAYLMPDYYDDLLTDWWSENDGRYAALLAIQWMERKLYDG